MEEEREVGRKGGDVPAGSLMKWKVSFAWVGLVFVSVAILRRYTHFSWSAAVSRPGCTVNVTAL